jgi:TRAP-type transport system periplasmic protein
MIKLSKKFSIFLTVVMLLSVLAGCAGGSGGDTPDGEAPEFEPVTFNMSHFMSNQHPLHTNILAPFAEEVFEKTEGRVTIQVYPNNELGAPSTTVDQVVSGAFEMGLTLAAYTPGRFPLTSILEFPFMFESSLQGNLVAADMRADLQEHDFADMKLLWVGGTDIAKILINKNVSTVDGLAGLKLRSPGLLYNDVIRGLGATELSLPVSDLYDAMDRNIVDGSLMSPSALISFKLAEVTKNVIDLNVYMNPLIFVMNSDAWAKVSPEDQQIMEDLLAEFPEKVGTQYDHEFDAGMKVAVEKNINVITFSDEEKTKLHAITDPLMVKWLADMDAKGLPGNTTYEKALEYIKNH